MPNVLQKILEDTLKAVKNRKQLKPISKPGNEKNNDSFLSAITRAQNPAIIAEIKAKSPSHGNFDTSLSIEERAKLYQHAGVTAISYVSNLTFFGGMPMNIQKIKKAVSIPVLQKDFVIDEYQVYEAAHYGADALLLIARIVSKVQLEKLIVECYSSNIEPVVELFDNEDLKKIEGLDVKVVGVNARDLNSLTTDIDKACTIISKVSKDTIVLGFSGISSKQDIEKYVLAGAKGVLIGAGVIKSDSIMHFIDSLR